MHPKVHVMQSRGEEGGEGGITRRDGSKGESGSADDKSECNDPTLPPSAIASRCSCSCLPARDEKARARGAVEGVEAPPCAEDVLLTVEGVLIMS